MERIVDLIKPPTLNEKYVVPHYPVILGHIGKRQKKWYVPVLLPAHDDKLLGFPFWHYHIDFRFFSTSDLVNYRERFITKYHNVPKEYWAAFLSNINAINTYSNTPEFKSIKWFPKKYVNSDIKINVELSVLQDKFKGKTYKCDKCPHKGINLLDQIPNENGIITCPAHGLKFQKQNNKIICI